MSQESPQFPEAVDMVSPRDFCRAGLFALPGIPASADTGTMLTTLPLVFSFKQLIAGNGFVAGVQMKGRALLEVDGDETWIMGIAPAGIAGGGLNRNAAFNEFRDGWVKVLFDIADEAEDFNAFDAACKEFLSGTEEHLTAEWDTALAAVRKEKFVDETLPSEPADDHEVGFVVVELQSPSANDNEQGAGLHAAA